MAYTATVTRLGHVKGVGSGGCDIAAYNVDITGYNSTLVKLSEIANDFRTIKGVIISSASDEGYWGTWVAASNSIKCWKATATQQDNAADNGAFDVLVFGYMNA